MPMQPPAPAIEMYVIVLPRPSALINRELEFFLPVLVRETTCTGSD